MEFDAQKLSISLIESLIRCDNSKIDLFFISLVRLNSTQYIFETFLQKYKSESNQNFRFRIIRIFMQYFQQKKTFLVLIPTSSLFDYFTTLGNEVTTLLSYSDFKSYADVLIILLKSLPTYKSEDLFSSIISWENPNWAIALYALSVVDTNFIGNCISNIKTNYSPSLPVLYSLIFFFQTYKLEELSIDVTNIFGNGDFYNILAQTISDIINQKLTLSSFILSDDQNFSYTEQITAQKLFGSLLHFLPSDASCLFVQEHKNFIEKWLTSCDEIQMEAMNVLCNLTNSYYQFTFYDQLNEFIPLFNKSISTFTNSLANSIVQFVSIRQKDEHFHDFIKSLFENDENCVLAALIVSCVQSTTEDHSYHDLFFNYIRDIFVDNQNLTLNRANAICLTVSYISKNDFIMKDSLIEPFLSSLCYIIARDDLILDPLLANNVPIAFSSFSIACKSFSSLYLKNLISYFKIFGEINNFYETGQQPKKSSLSIILMGLTKLMNIVEPFVPMKVSAQEYVDATLPLYTLLAKISSDDDFLDLLLFVLSLFSTALKGISTDQINSIKFIKKNSNICLAQIFQSFLTEEVADLMFEKVKYLSSKPDSDPIFNVIATSLPSSQPASIQICQNILDHQPFDPNLFRQFFTNAAVRNISQTLVFFVKSIREIPIQKPSFLQSSILKFLGTQQPKPVQFTVKSILETLNDICTYCTDLGISEMNLIFLGIEHLYPLIFDQNGHLLDKSEPNQEFLSLYSIISTLSKKRIKASISYQLVQNILSNSLFCELFSDFLFLIDSVKNHISLAVSSWLSSNNLFQPQDHKEFLTSCFTVYNESYQLIYNQLMKNFNIQFAEQLSKFCDPQSLQTSIVMINRLVNACFLESEQDRQSASNALQYLFLVDAFPKTNINLSTPSNLIQTTTLENKFRSKELFSSIVNSIPFKSLSIDVFRNCLEFGQPNSCFIEAISMNFEISKQIVKTAPDLLKILIEKEVTAEKLYEYSALKNGQNSLDINFYSNALKNFAKHNYFLFIQYICSSKQNLINDDFIYNFFINNEENVSISILDEFFNYVLTFSFNDDSDVLHPVIIILNTLTKMKNFENDIFIYKLIWIQFCISVILISSSEKLFSASQKKLINNINTNLCNLLYHFSLIPCSIIDSDFLNYESISTKFASIFMSFSYNILVDLLENIPIIKKTTLSEFVVSVEILLIKIIHTLIQKTCDQSAESTIRLYCKKICEIAKISKDECSRFICAIFSKTFTVKELEIFNDEERGTLLVVSSRSLINMIDSSKIGDILFFTKIILIVSPHYINENFDHYLDTLTRCFDNEKEVGFEPLLDAMKALILANHSIIPYVSMSQISIARVLVFSYDENQEISNRANEILRILCDVKDDEDILNGLVKKLGVKQTTTYALFLLDRFTKYGVNKDGLTLVENITKAILATDKKDENLDLSEMPQDIQNGINLIAKKAGPVILPIACDISNPLQNYALDFLSLLVK